MGYPLYSPDYMAPLAGPRSSRLGNELQADLINGRRPSTATLGYATDHARKDIARQRPRGRVNSNLTIVYSLCMPIPSERYGHKQYFSGPSVFIPYPPSPFRQVGAEQC